MVSVGETEKGTDSLSFAGADRWTTATCNLGNGPGHSFLHGAETHIT
jgi:hypothetical protein